MNKYFFNCILFSLLFFLNNAQNKIDVKAVFDVPQKKITINQTITYYNTTNAILDTIYLNDWNNSFSTKQTALATRIADEYNNNFHLAKNEDRGYSVITSIKQDNVALEFSPLKDQIDVVKVVLSEPLMPNSSYTIYLNYIVQIPNSKFTDYGFTSSGDLNLRYWYITPAVYNGQWQYYSNKNLDDLYIPKADVNLELFYPKNYDLVTELDRTKIVEQGPKKVEWLTGKDRVNNKLFLRKNSKFETLQNEKFSVVSDINDSDITLINKVLITERVTDYIFESFGEYPHNKLLLSQIDVGKNPIYGLNFLPKFLKTYPNDFKYELVLLKTALHNYLENILLLNPRTEQWLVDGIQIYYLMNYVEKYYPDMKFFGALADYWLTRPFHASKMKFNDKYILAFMIMARTNRDQPLTMPKDSLLKFNQNIANKYKAGVGFNYLDDFVNQDVVKNSIETFIKQNHLKETSVQDFETFIKSRTNKNIDWFFNDYLSTRKKIDFKIKKVIKTEDSITLTIKNKRDNAMPVSLYGLNNDSIVSKYWVQNVKGEKTVTVPRKEANKLVLNYENKIPEFNLRDNWKSLKGFFFNNKPFQFRLFKDIEDPYYNQVFFMPVIEYNNIYDGLTLGMRAYNTTVLRKRFKYKIEPNYSINSKSLTGSVSIANTHYFENTDLYYLNYGFSGRYSSYARDLFVRQLTPSVTLLFRDKDDFRSNKRQFLRFRYVDIHRDQDVDSPFSSTEPNYGVFNIRYIHSNDNLIKFGKWYTDFQLSEDFSKLSFNYEFRKLFENNKQLNVRFFAGTFLSNKTEENADYFSFALDRPTDYLFDYNYLGRSEDSGIFSQQYIEAEGGFKSQLESKFANQWITTFNASTTLWKYILLYGDIGLVKNKFDSPKFVYDSGIRIDLVTDYFEIYLPIYSNLGWEMGLPNYDQKIRFKFTLDPQALLGLFRRRWY